MARLIPGSSEEGNKTPNYTPVFIDGELYTNTASKFWLALIAEAKTDYPDCNSVELTAPSSELLSEKHLRPELSLSESIENLLDKDLSQTIKETINEMEMFGPPSPVKLRVMSGDRKLLSADFPLDCVDEEIFSCLLVWLLEWADIERDLWNNEFLHGSFKADSLVENHIIKISFDLKNQHLSEGLFNRTLLLHIT